MTTPTSPWRRRRAVVAEVQTGAARRSAGEPGAPEQQQRGPVGQPDAGVVVLERLVGVQRVERRHRALRAGEQGHVVGGDLQPGAVVGGADPAVCPGSRGLLDREDGVEADERRALRADLEADRGLLGAELEPDEAAGRQVTRRRRRADRGRRRAGVELHLDVEGRRSGCRPAARRARWWPGCSRRRRAEVDRPGLARPPERYIPAPSVSSRPGCRCRRRRRPQGADDSVRTRCAPVPVWVNVKLPSDPLAGDHEATPVPVTARPAGDRATLHQLVADQSTTGSSASRRWPVLTFSPRVPENSTPGHVEDHGAGDRARHPGRPRGRRLREPSVSRMTPPAQARARGC